MASGATTADKASHLAFNDRLDAALTALFCLAMWVLVLEVVRFAWKLGTGRSVPPSSETPFVETRWQRA